jgi:hypothetical protein
MPLKRDELPGVLLRGADEVQRVYLATRGAEPEPAAATATAEPGAGVDASRTKGELMDDAKAAGIPGRSKMSKEELVDALEQHARGGGA